MSATSRPAGAIVMVLAVIAVAFGPPVSAADRQRYWTEIERLVS